MVKVHVFSNGERIGWCELSASDPAMGVATGAFHPTGAYEAIRPLVLRLWWDHPPDKEAWASLLDSLKLQVVTDDGVDLQPVGGIMIMDSASIGDPETIDMDVAGINCADGTYERYFGSDEAYLAYWK